MKKIMDQTAAALEMVNDDLDKLFFEIELKYYSLEKKPGSYQFSGDDKYIWATRTQKLFENDGYPVIKVSSDKILVGPKD